MSENHLRFVIIGAGIAGLASATALRGEGHDILVLERTSSKSEIGAAIHLMPNAAKLALDWGLDIERVGALCSKSFQEYTQLDVLKTEVAIDWKEKIGYPLLYNHRVDLHTEFKRLATRKYGKGTPARIREGAEVVHVDPDTGVVTLRDGETVQGDVIIAADGVHCKLRTVVNDGQDYPAQRSGHSAYRSLIPKEALDQHKDLKSFLEEPAAFRVWVGQDRRVVAYPCRRFEYLNIVAILPDSQLNEQSHDSWTVSGSVAEQVKAYKDAGFGERILRLLGCSPSCALYELRDSPPLPHWTKGRLILIGDAAHPMLPHMGQGGGQAVEDAEAVGVMFQDLTSRSEAHLVPHRLKDVELIRKERATNLQKFSRQQSEPPKEGGHLNPYQYEQYAFHYPGALGWAKEHNLALSSSPVAAAA